MRFNFCLVCPPYKAEPNAAFGNMSRLWHILSYLDALSGPQR